MVNWCPGLGTVLANEEVTADGRSDRGNFPVFRKRLRQWMMRITAYSDRLLDDLDLLDWPEQVKTMQRNWIGRSTGAAGAVLGDRQPTAKRSTSRCSPPGPTPCSARPTWCWRPSTSWSTSWSPAPGRTATDPRWTYGAATPAEAVAAYRRAIAAKSDLERQESREKTGVFLGSYAINPANGKPVPIFIADYVLAGYGTGAIMAVPGHDQRDWEFAREFGLPIVEVIAGGDISEAAYTGDGVLVNSGYLDGMDVAAAKEAITARLEADGRGRARIELQAARLAFRPAAVLGRAVPDRLRRRRARRTRCAKPHCRSSCPTCRTTRRCCSTPTTPTASRRRRWPRRPNGCTSSWTWATACKPYTRDTNVMPQWAGSSWYELRYTDPHNSERFCAKENEAYWMGPRPAEHGPDDPGGVDLYVGGAEHAVLHLLYARFWHKVLYDLGHVSSREPYRRLVNQGYIQAFAYTDARGSTYRRRRWSSGTASSSTRARRRGRSLPGVRQNR